MRPHDWRRRPTFDGAGREMPGRGCWICTRCALEVPFHAGYEGYHPGDDFVVDFLHEELDCDLRVVRSVMDV